MNPAHMMWRCRNVLYQALPTQHGLLGSEVYSTNLEEAAEYDGKSAGPVEVHELEDVGPALCHHAHAHQEEEKAQARRELATDRPEKRCISIFSATIRFPPYQISAFSNYRHALSLHIY